MTTALSNGGCCSHRKAISETKSEAAAQVQTEVSVESRSESGREATLASRTERQGVTLTEVEIYADPVPGDSADTAPRLKARIRQRHGDVERQDTRQAEAERTAAEAKTESATAYEGGTLDEVTVTATKAPGLWERLKQGAAWATAILLPAAAGWIIYKYQKCKTT